MSEIDLDELNDTELVLLAQDENPNVHRGLSRSVLIDIIEGEEVPLADRGVDICRDDIYAFVDENWKQVEPLISCPMKSRDPRACYTCTDIQVAECTIQNHTRIPFRMLTEEE